MKYNLFNKLFLSFVFVLIFTSIYATENYLTDTIKSNVTGFTQDWLSLKFSGKYQDAYNYFTPEAKNNTPFDEWIADEKNFSQLSGEVLKITSEIVYWENNPPNVQAGTYFLINAYCEFENVNKYKSSITLRMDNTNKFEILTTEYWFVDSETENLIRELQSKYDGDRFPTRKVSKEDIHNYLNEILGLSGWKSFEKDDQIIINDAEPNTIHIFTTPQHAAHPASIKLKELEVNGVKGVMKYGHFSGSENEFNRWQESIQPAGNRSE